MTAIGAMSLAACATINVGADFSPSTNFQSFSTYAWEVQDDLPTGDPRLDKNPFFDARWHEAVDHQLAVKGMRRGTDAPDLLVHYHASVRDRIDIRQIDEPRDYQGATETFVYQEGTILLDIADARSKRVIWRGWAQADLADLLIEPESMALRLADIARRMFERFPRVDSSARPVVTPPPTR
jgi:hypothetical protein